VRCFPRPQRQIGVGMAPYPTDIRNKLVGGLGGGAWGAWPFHSTWHFSSQKKRKERLLWKINWIQGRVWKVVGGIQRKRSDVDSHNEKKYLKNKNKL
jgi:hypothetical protein